MALITNPLPEQSHPKKQLPKHNHKNQQQNQKQKQKPKPKQKPPSSWDQIKNILTCKQIEGSKVHDPSKPNNNINGYSKLSSSCSSICSFRDVVHGNTRVVHRSDNSSPESSILGQETSLLKRKPVTASSSSSSTTRSASNGGRNYTSSSSSSRGMQFRKLSGCYECHMIVDPSRLPIPRSTVCACDQCGEVFPKIESLELHQAVRHAGYKMIGSFLTWALVSVFGYAYPAYECYKVVEKNKPEIEQLRFWCQYWILVAVLTVGERFGDTLISWVPMYSEAKLAFFIFLWYPKTKGTTYVYDSFFRPYVAKHEPEIDRNLMELRTRAGDYVVLYCQRAASYGQTRIYDILKFVSAQSTPAPRPAQQRPGVRVRKPAPAKDQPAAAAEPQVEEPPSPASSTSSSQFQKEVAEELESPQAPKAAPPQASKAAPPVAGLNKQKSSVAGLNKQKSSVADLKNQKPPVAGLNTQKSSVASLITQKSAPTSETIIISSSTESDSKKIEAASPSSSSASENGKSPKKETIMEESIRVTRGRLRKTRSAGTR